jgi:hypothetical protein
MASHAASLRDRIRAMLAPDAAEATTDAKKPKDQIDAPAPVDDGDGPDDENPMTDKDAAAPAGDAEDKKDGGADEGDENPDGSPKKKPKAEASQPEAGQVDAAGVERARWATVLRSDVAATRMTAAVELLAETDMPADRLMASLGKFGAKNAAGSNFANRMASEANPSITPNGGTDASAAPSVLSVMQARHPKKGA